MPRFVFTLEPVMKQRIREEERAQRALAELGETDRDAVLAETHRRLREDIAAIWDLLPQAGAATGRRQN